MIKPGVAFERFGSSRPGLTLIAVRQAAVPVTVVTLTVLAQERKGLPLLDEFVLRAVAAKQRRIDDIASLCGIEPGLVAASAVNQAALGNIIYSAVRGTLALTSLGIQAAEELTIIQPIRTDLKMTFDRAIWKPANYRRTELMSKDEARSAGMTIMPAARSSRIGVTDISVPTLNRFVQQGEVGDSKFQILNLEKVKLNRHQYLPVTLLIFVDPRSERLEAVVVVANDASEPHEFALIAGGGTVGLGYKLAEIRERPTLDQELEEARRAIRATGIVRVAAVDDSTVRPVSTLEHHVLLDGSLRSAKDRILIVSRSDKTMIHDESFLDLIEGALSRSVPVKLVVSEEEQRKSGAPTGRVAELAAAYPALLKVRWGTSVGVNQLVVDNLWISTSFDWIELEAADSLVLKRDEGTLVTIAEYVDRAHLTMSAQYFGG